MARPEVSLSTLNTLLPYEQEHMLDKLSEDLRKAGLQQGE